MLSDSIDCCITQCKIRAKLIGNNGGKSSGPITFYLPYGINDL